MSLARSGRRPRIALVTDAIFPFHRGGKEVRYHEVSTRLAADADVTVYTMRWWEHRGSWHDGPVKYVAICPLLPLYVNHRRSIPQAVLFALCTLRLLIARFDVLEADHMPYVQLVPLWCVAKLRRTRFVVTWHEVWGAQAWHDYLGPLGRFAWALERFTMRLPDEIVAASEQTADRLRPFVRETTRLTVAPNGVDLELAHDAVPDPEHVDLVVVGRFLPHKRIDLVLETLAFLRRTGSDVTCRVIGDGPGRADMHALATDLGVADAVDFRHDVGDQRDLFSLLKASTVFVFPSEREGFGIAVLEALACGLPVVTTSAPDNIARLLVERSERGVVCAPSVAALADAVRPFLVASALPEQSGRAAAEESEWLGTYDWLEVASRVREACLR